ncbi:type II toxin-antitoxin system VapB family antitoxin [Antarcticirhabdus aurantiaca]|uniref:Type II toxin-antitoxin system VapB family antitoxin n=1 Tax=Antarcticirhabdus aurantiaca TaxID=2606717 RepID=A0ACD4NU60_9HYPH|nr:type II toxin-antitoxin system VapB family antitoxin [Antarcticirhabdus aurantiaca]WAJ30451.1 type II toxin-antitoxin system VapB family antitoxin [Jeongeuplla avenae]
MADMTVEIDEGLLRRALEATRTDDARALIEKALGDMVRQREAQRRLRDLAGKIEWEGDLDEMRRDRHQPLDRT